MEYTVTIRVPAANGAYRMQREDFDDFGAAVRRALEVFEANRSGGGAEPVSITDTGERQLLGQKEFARLAAIVGKAAPVGDQIARQVFGALDEATLDTLCRWLVFKMRPAGINQQQRLHVLGAILDAVSPDQ